MANIVLIIVIKEALNLEYVLNMEYNRLKLLRL